jgi:hypothetical protein
MRMKRERGGGLDPVSRFRGGSGSRKRGKEKLAFL